MAVTAMQARRTSEAEWQMRVDLAACYRLVDLFGWSDLINTRITARIPGPHDHFLINRFGMLYDEITASSLVKIDIEGNNVEPSDDAVNRGGFAIPGTIHRARPDIACVIHTHTIAGCAVSMQKAGLLPLNAESGSVAPQPARASGDRRPRLSRLRGDRQERRRARALSRRFRR